MSRRRFLHLTATAATGALLSACGPTATENAPMEGDEILAAARLTTPTLDTTVADAPLKGDEAWSKVVTFTGSREEVEAWVEENFRSGIESEAYKDDMAAFAERIGPWVQKKGDRIVEGVEGSVVYLAAIRQGDTPEVHVAVRRTGR